MSEPERYPQLLSLAVHEFRTPASVVGGYLRMLLRDVGDPLSDRQRKMIEEAEKSCARLVALIAELSDISKLDADLIAFAQQPIDLFSLVGEVAGQVHEAKDRDEHLEVRGDTAGAPVRGDAVRLRSAFDAVFRAILREKGEPCTVLAERRCATHDGRPMAVVIVAQDGDVEAAYERAPAPFDEKRGGLGLALPLARRVIERHGGRIWAPAPNGDNDNLARGSAIMALPVTESMR
jgi:signal transduction histidine kinase